MYLNSSKLATVNNLMLNLNTFKFNTKLTILPTLCDTGKLDWPKAASKFSVSTLHTSHRSIILNSELTHQKKIRSVGIHFE